jgi:uncharacterized protein YukE
MSPLEAVAATLRAQAAQVAQQRAVALALIQRLTGARDALHAATTGAASPEAARSVQALSEAVEALQRAVKHLGAVVAHIAAYGPALGVNLGPSVTGAGGQESSRPDTAVSQPEALPEPITRMSRRLPPRPDDRGPTHGWLLDEHLRPVGGQFRSGEDFTLIADLDLQGREPLARSLLADVESKVAAAMRRGQAGPACALVINNTPCRGRLGCDTLLPDILPANSRLTVYVSDANGVKLYKTYTGTGRKIRQ